MQATHPNSVEAYKLLHEGTLAFAKSERQGIRLDEKELRKQKKQLAKSIESIENEFKESKFYKGWKKYNRDKPPNIDSNPQLSDYIYNSLKVKPKITTAAGKGSTGEEALELLNIPELQQLIKARKQKKLRDTYIAQLERECTDGFVHPFFNLNTARTYRSSSNSPNFQNFPKREEEARVLRKMLKPRKGCQLLEADYAQLEVRIAACYNKDPVLIKYIKDPGSDMHYDMAKQIFKLSDKEAKALKGIKTLRQAAKNSFVFPQFYGDYYKNNAHSIVHNWCHLSEKRWQKGEGVELNDNYFASDLLRDKDLGSYRKFTEHLREIETHFWQNRFQVYNKWKDRTYKDYQKNGFVDMHTGFRCKGLMGKNDVTNYPVQGAAFHCLLWSYIEMDKVLRKKRMKTKLIGQIHDAIILDVWPSELEEVKRLLREVMVDKLKQAWTWIIVPLEIEIDLGEVDASWADLQTIE